MGKLTLIKRGSKRDREEEVLLGLVDLYVKQGRPIGSNTLKENGFSHLSSATIRNYFAHLEMEGLLKQHHASGGRIPTDKAYRIYAEKCLEEASLSQKDDQFLATLLLTETREISAYLQKAVHAVSEMTGCAAFIAAPKFDQDFIIRMKIMRIDEDRAVCALLTDFSMIHTEILYIPSSLVEFPIELLEAYFQFRLTGHGMPNLPTEAEEFAKQCYNEIVLRHFVNYTNIHIEDVHKAGFSKLLQHVEFHDPLILSNTLSLFENTDSQRELLNECYKDNTIHFWIGSDLKHILPPPHAATVIAVPYKIHNKTVGAIALLGPDRLPYREIFGFLDKFSKYLSENLTKSMYKFKLTYRQPRSKVVDMKYKSAEVIGLTHKTLIRETDDI